MARVFQRVNSFPPAPVPDEQRVAAPGKPVTAAHPSVMGKTASLSVNKHVDSRARARLGFGGRSSTTAVGQDSSADTKGAVDTFAELSYETLLQIMPQVGRETQDLDNPETALEGKVENDFLKIAFPHLEARKEILLAEVQRLKEQDLSTELPGIETAPVEHAQARNAIQARVRVWDMFTMLIEEGGQQWAM